MSLRQPRGCDAYMALMSNCSTAAPFDAGSMRPLGLVTPASVSSNAVSNAAPSRALRELLALTGSCQRSGSLSVFGQKVAFPSRPFDWARFCRPRSRHRRTCTSRASLESADQADWMCLSSAEILAQTPHDWPSSGSDPKNSSRRPKVGRAQMPSRPLLEPRVQTDLWPQVPESLVALATSFSPASARPRTDRQAPSPPRDDAARRLSLWPPSRCAAAAACHAAWAAAGAQRPRR
mmetsp:Transcript_44329/g.96512  ORF Transcript_44329/g.96512 Transcript_44329/m.96512 type:complete len:235 (+) Transcript_44329:326-1030(+)